jgi:hypothetical protein
MSQPWRSLVALAPGVCLATGCNLYFNAAPDAGSAADAAVSVDALNPTLRINLPFMAAEPTQFDGGDPSLSNDGLDLWFVPTDTSTTKKYDIYHARRPAINASFQAATEVNVNSSDDDIDGAVTDDRLLISFASNRVPKYTIFEAKRSSASEAFDTPVATNLAIDNFRGFDASPDGLTVMYPDGSVIKVFTRNTRNETYKAAPDIALADTNVSYATISFDRRELVYSPDGKQLVRALLSLDGKEYAAPQPFALGVTCNSSMTDPDFSSDAMALTFACNGKVYIATRVAP